MNENELKARTKQFGLRVMNLVNALPKITAGRALGNQLIRSGTSVGANYRAACRGRSKAEFIAKIGRVAEEADESAFWMELILEGGLLSQGIVLPLHTEAEERTAIFTVSGRTAKLNNQKSAIPNPNSTMSPNPQSTIRNQKC